MKYEEIESKFDSYFKFEAQRAFVTPEDAKFFAQHIATQVEERADKLRAAICKTLDDNSHLADGEACTLHTLKVALRETGAPWAGEIQAELDALNEKYEIPLNRHFYRYEPPRELAVIESEIKSLEADIVRLLGGGCTKSLSDKGTNHNDRRKNSY